MTTTPGKILFSGATGTIGSALVRAAEAERIQAVQLVRHQPASSSEIRWNPDAAVPVSDPAPLEGIGAAIHLSGANLSSHRWTADYKRQILESRVNSTRALVNTLRSLKQRPPVFLCASATGIYGNRGDEILTEESNPGRGLSPIPASPGRQKLRRPVHWGSASCIFASEWSCLAKEVRSSICCRSFGSGSEAIWPTDASG